MNKNSKLSDAPNDNHFSSSEIGKGKSKWNDWYIDTYNIYIYNSFSLYKTKIWFESIEGWNGVKLRVVYHLATNLIYGFEGHKTGLLYLYKILV